MVSQVGTVSVVAGSLGTSQFTIPSGIQNGDVVVLGISLENSTAPTPPVDQGYRTLGIETTGSLSLNIFYTVLSSNDSSTFHTFTHANTWRNGAGVILRDVDLTELLAVTSPVAATSGTDTSIETPSESSSNVANAWVLWFATTFGDTIKSYPGTADGNTVTQTHGAGLSNIGLGRAEYTSVSSVSSISVGLDAAPTNWLAKTVVVRPASGDQAPYLHGAGTAVFTATSGATLAPGLPSGWAADDVHVLIAHRSDNTAMTALSGWTQLSAANNTTAQRVEVWARRAVAGDTAPTITFGTGTVVRGARIVGIRGVDSGLALSSIDLSRSDNAASLTVTWATLTPANNDSLLLALLAYEDDPPSAAQISGWSNFTMSTSALGSDMALGYAVRGWQSGATGGLTSLTGGPSSPNVGVLLGFKPVSSGPPSVSGSGGVSLSKPAFSGAGTELDFFSGTGGVSVVRPVLSGVGELEYVGAGGITVGAPVLVGSGGLAYAGVGGIAVSGPVLGGVGVLAYVGIGGVVVSVPSLSGSGVVLGFASGVGSVIIGVPSLSGVGILAYAGIGGVSIDAPVLSGVGTYEGPIGGFGNVTISAPTFTGSGYLAYVGIGGISIGLPVLGGAGTSISNVFASGGIVIGSAILSGTGILTYVGSGGISIGQPILVGAGGYGPVGFGGVSVEAPVLAGLGVLTYVGDGGISVGMPILSGIGLLEYAGIGAINIGVPIFNAVGGFVPAPILGMGSVVIGVPTLSGIGVIIGLMPDIPNPPGVVVSDGLGVVVIRSDGSATTIAGGHRVVLLGTSTDVEIV